MLVEAFEECTLVDNFIVGVDDTEYRTVAFVSKFARAVDVAAGRASFTTTPELAQMNLM